MTQLKALGDTFVVREIDHYEQSNVIHVDLADMKYLRGVVMSVGPEVEYINEGDTVVFSDGVKRLDDVVDEPVYLVKEDAVLCKVV